MSIANQTIPGSYRVVQVDGEDVVLQKVGDRWVTTAERLAQEKTTDFMARFQGTDTVPAPAGERVCPLVAKPGGAEAKYQQTSSRLDAYLGEILGDPALLFRGDPLALERLAKAKQHPDVMRQIRGLIQVFNNPTWNRVLQELL